MDIDKLDRFRYVLSLTNVGEDEIISASRKRELVSVRQMLMYFCSTELDMSLKQIGRLLNRDHSTVIHGKRLFKKYIAFKDGEIGTEAKRYNVIIKRYYEKYGEPKKFYYICANDLEDRLASDLLKLMSKRDLNTHRTFENNIRKSELDKFINIVKELKKNYYKHLKSIKC